MQSPLRRPCAASRCVATSFPPREANGAGSAGAVGDLTIGPWTIPAREITPTSPIPCRDYADWANQLLASPHRSRSVHSLKLALLLSSPRQIAPLTLITGFVLFHFDSSHPLLGSSFRLRFQLISPISPHLASNLPHFAPLGNQNTAKCKHAIVRGYPYPVGKVPRKFISPRNYGVIPFGPCTPSNPDGRSLPPSEQDGTPFSSNRESFTARGIFLFQNRGLRFITLCTDCTRRTSHPIR